MFAADGTQITEASATGQPPAEGPYSATPGAIGGFSPPNVQPIALPASAGLEDGSVNDYLRPTKLAGVAAGRIPDRRLMVAKGKMIDCVLDTAISTVVAGMVRCTMTRDIYGEDGKAVLLDRGTEMTGEYRANLHTGQARLGIVWDRAKTPHGVLIKLASPASDPLGRAGVDGFVDTHFWEKYGAAILLSSLDDLLIIVTNNARNNQVFIPANSERAGRDAATTALEQDLRIPPTLIKNQGEHITIFVARDLDFRSVYAYRAPVRTAYE